MRVNPAEVKKVGSEHYPELAGYYSDAASTISSMAGVMLDTIADHRDLHDQLSTMGENLGKYLDESSSHLERCGEVLVEIANEYDWVDEDNSHHVDDASKGLDDKRN